MKNIKLKIVSILLVVVTILAFGATAFAGNNDSVSADISGERILNEQNSIIAYNKIYNAFNSSGNIIEYGDSYAGAYLNDLGELVVLITSSDAIQSEQELRAKSESNILTGEIQADSALFEDKSIDFKKEAVKLQEIAQSEESNHIIFQEAKYSYKYLTELMEQLNVSSQKNQLNIDSIWSEITSFALLDDKNCILIEMRNLDNLKIKRFQTEVNDSDVFCFRNSIAEIKQQTAINPGASGVVFLSPSKAIGYSVGYWARHSLGNGSYEYGFVTCAHGGLENGGAVYLVKGTTSEGPIGKCTVIQNNAGLDAAFIKSSSGYDVSDTTMAGTTLYQYGYSSPLVGSTVYKEGATTGKTSGKVTSSNTSYSFGGITYTNVMSANYNSAGGDSGGVVYDGLNYVVGIHVAGLDKDIAGNRYVTKASRIDQLLSVYP